MPLVSVYVRDILHGTGGEAQLLPTLLLLSTMLTALLPWTRPSRTDSVIDPAERTVLPTSKEAPDVRASV
jgi:hypothetical protein